MTSRPRGDSSSSSARRSAARWLCGSAVFALMHRSRTVSVTLSAAISRNRSAPLSV